ncbi:MAG: hypothetical protein K9K67_05725 [Bacteriovoracaceae bacterium]|nr:hypothetical protein [Bacteriovoracaceae bacterium]
MQILKYLILVFSVLSGLFFGCTRLPNDESNPHSLQRRKVEEYFVSSGVVRYFLPEIPYWANFSESAGCRREESIKYLDLKMVRGSLSLTYEEAIQLQLMLNNMIFDLKEEKHISHIPFKEEEGLFFKASDRIQAGIRTFRVPKFKRVHLIWIDPYLKNVTGLKELMQKSSVGLGHPVFVSLCLTRSHLDNWMKTNDFANKNIRLLSYEMLSPYDLEGELKTKYHIFVDEIFGKDKSTFFYGPKDRPVPQVFEGNFKIIRY